MRRKRESKDNKERWLLTYSDLITLLMILFVLMYAMSNVDQEKYSQLAASLNQSMGGGVLNNGSSVLPGQSGILTGGDSQDMTVGDTSDETQAATTQAETSTATTTATTAATASASDQSNMESVKSTLENIIKTNSLDGDIGVSITSVGLVITFPSTVFFESGSATLNDNLKTALDKIAPEINTISNDVTVKAYTDNRPISNTLYASNWQLSSARASNVVQYLADTGNVNYARLSAVGCGENNPIDTNDTEEGRSRNRRIEINLLYTSNSTQATVQPISK